MIWTKKLPKKSGYYWFWCSNDTGWPEIVRVYETVKDNFKFQQVYGHISYDVESVPDHFSNYKFGPEIKVPSARNLRKKYNYRF